MGSFELADGAQKDIFYAPEPAPGKYFLDQLPGRWFVAAPVVRMDEHLAQSYLVIVNIDEGNGTYDLVLLIDGEPEISIALLVEGTHVAKIGLIAGSNGHPKFSCLDAYDEVDGLLFVLLVVFYDLS